MSVSCRATPTREPALLCRPAHPDDTAIGPCLRRGDGVRAKVPRPKLRHPVLDPGSRFFPSQPRRTAHLVANIDEAFRTPAAKIDAPYQCVSNCTPVPAPPFCATIANIRAPLPIPDAPRYVGHR
ncbi:hypothetical protein GCM10022253_29080 [Sphingomonas endophytica]